jgi:hypothetical protein
VTAVHQDKLPGDRQDWLVRPIRRSDLFLAKLLFVLGVIFGPMLLADLAQCMASGFSVQDSLSAASWRSLYSLLFFGLPALTIAAVTASIVEVIGVFLALCVVFIIFMITIVVGVPDNGAGTFSAMSGHWLMFELWMAVGLAVAALVIPLEYFRRAIMPARGIVLGGILLLVPVSVFLPWSSAFAFVQWFSADPASARPISVAFDPALGKAALRPGDADPAHAVWLPLRLTALAPDSILLNDRTYLRVIGPDGAILYHGVVVPGEGQPTARGFPVRSAAGGEARIHQRITLPAKVYEIARSHTVRMELDYSLTLFRAASSDRIAAVDGGKRMAGLGLCRTRVDEDGDEVEFGCLSTGRVFPDCGVLTLENAVSGQRNPAKNFCNDDFLPYNAHFAPDAMLHMKTALAFRDPRGLVKYPVERGQLADAQVTVKTFTPVVRFTRHIVIPEIRLSDWEASPPPQ